MHSALCILPSVLCTLHSALCTQSTVHCSFHWIPNCPLAWTHPYTSVDPEPSSQAGWRDRATQPQLPLHHPKDQEDYQDTTQVCILHSEPSWLEPKTSCLAWLCDKVKIQAWFGWGSKEFRISELGSGLYSGCVVTYTSGNYFY